MAAGLPTSVVTEIEFTAGVWTDVSTFVKGDSMEISVGADSAASGVQPGTLDLALDNADGRFTPDNPTSTYYPNFVEGKRIRVTVTKGVATSIRHLGRITSLEPDFPLEPTQSVTRVSAVDLLGDLARTDLSTHSQDLARRQTTPTVFYPLADTNGSDGFVDLFNLANRLTIRDVTTGSGGVDASSDSSLGDGQSYVTLTSGKALWHASPGIPSSVTSGGWVLSALVNLSFASLGTVLTISKGQYVAGVTPAHALTLEGPAPYLLRITSYDGSGTSTTGVTSGIAGQLVEGWNFIQVSNTGQLVVNNQPVTTSRTITNVDSLQIGGDIDMSVGQVLINNGVGTYLLDARYEISYSVPLTLYDVLNEYANTVRYTDLGVLFYYVGTPLTNTAVWPATAGKTALDTLVAIAESSGSTVYHLYDTSWVLIPPPDGSRLPTPAITVDAEGDLISGPSAARDINRVTATSTATSRAGTVTVVSSSATGVGATDETHEVVLRSKDDLAAVASFFAARGANQRSRISQLTVDLANASNDLYPTWLSTGPTASGFVGTRLRLSGLPSTYFGVTYIDGYIAGWKERPSVNGYEVTFNLDPADAPPEAAFDDATYARFGWGDGVCTLTSGITASATSLSLTFTGSALLSTSAGDYPLDLDVNGERVTITSAPAGGTSPRTVTVTRGVAPTVARAHSAGEPIDVWNAARIAL